MKDLPADIQSVVRGWPRPAQSRFEEIRGIVHDAARRARIGDLVETTKWAQPAWLPARPRIGTTLRCDWHAGHPDTLGLFVHCQTSVVETMRTLYPTAFVYEGNRALRLSLTEEFPADAIDHCAFLTLTYHRKSA
ncbi:DUF1801 domain-containing protein [Roseobacter sp. YSTF-M11]|uniref:DUF1801 domain-containing protein n=1 Tax=Roseobacter insulae TaxID=2859783 RepID=A0A9X1FUS0_9RHOB|nr:DUF1801 domain-containing protein [Roseobacter insulae]MBW4707951.1 DUF1801 domain-containing protein [Roseobacter insulae]